VSELASSPSRSSSRPDPERRWTLKRVFAFGAAAAALVTLGAFALGAAALVRLSETRTVLLDQVGPAVLSAQVLLGDLVDQETGVRGFALGGGNPDDLDPYRQGLTAQQADEASIRALIATGGHETVAADLDALDAAVGRWRSAFAQPSIDRSPDTPPSAVGRLLFDQVRVAVQKLQSDLNAERLAARGALNRAADNLALVGVGVTLMIAGFLVATGFGLRRSVLRPVSALAAQVRAVASGDTAHPVVADGPREIVELGADVDSMRLAILRDVEAAQEANRFLDAQTRDLERSNNDLEQFAYVASHDLQEPLRKVASFCQLLQRRYAGKLDDRADQYIAFAVDGAERMQQLINDLLSFSRVGRNTAAFVDVALDDVVATAVAQLEPARADVEGTIDVKPLPVIRGDASLLRALFINLIGNGMKFHREGVPPWVTVSASQTAEDWEITVTDNGIGIDPDYADKVFVIFQRLHARDAYGGTGIGLALAKKIVEFHGGRIGIDAPRDEPGTTVRLTLPAPQENT
jgi:signal transduction histidine kinase